MNNIENGVLQTFPSHSPYAITDSRVQAPRTQEYEFEADNFSSRLLPFLWYLVLLKSKRGQRLYGREWTHVGIAGPAACRIVRAFPRQFG